MSGKSDAELMTAFLDEQLDPADADAFETLLESSPKVREEIDELKRMLEIVSDLAPVEAPPDFLENVSRKLRRRRPAGEQLLFSLVSLPFQVLSILIILTIAATYLMLELERDDGRLEKDPSAHQEPSNEPPSR
jgi:anti-sigma factor RsiW